MLLFCINKLNNNNVRTGGSYFHLGCDSGGYLYLACITSYVKDDKTQPTPISKEEYTRFKQFVQDTHGTTRGHLSTEIENALREYRQPDNQSEPINRIEDDVATIKAMLASSEADGGTVAHAPESDSVRTHADSDKPNKNAPRSDKIEWFIREKYRYETGSTSRSVLEKQIMEEFGFAERTAKDYVDQILTELDAEENPDPEYSGVFYWGEALEQKKAEIKEEAEGEAGAME